MFTSFLIWISCGVLVGLAVAGLWGRSPRTLDPRTFDPRAVARTRVQMIFACLLVAILSGWLFGFFIGDRTPGLGGVSSATFGAILAACAMWWHGLETIRSNQPQFFRII